jgi:hypothetical protein
MGTHIPILTKNQLFLERISAVMCQHDLIEISSLPTEKTEELISLK